MSLFTDEILQVNGRSFRVLRGGQGPLVVFLHGFAITADMWRPNLPGFIEAGYSVMALDLPGHGGSYRPTRLFSVADLTEAVQSLLTTLCPEPFFLVGNSLGGAVATELALRAPEQVRKLVLLDALGLDAGMILASLRRRKFWTHMIYPSAAQMLIGARPWIRARQMEVVYTCPTNAVPDVFVVDYPGGWRWNYLGRFFVGLSLVTTFLTPGARRAFVQRRAHLRPPTFILWGADDQVIPVAHANAGQALIPGARLHIFPNSGHGPNIEHMEEFNKLVMEFLAEGKNQ